MPPRFALFHATPNAIAPAVAALRRERPDVDLRHYLDEGLLDAERGGASDDVLVARIGRWMRQIESDGCAAVLLTCSSFSHLLPRLRLRVALPLVGIDEALHAAAVAAGRRIAVFATLPSALPLAVRSLQCLAAARGEPVAIVPELVEGALAALQAGDAATHDRLIRQRLVAAAPHHDVLLLAQISMARAREGLPQHPPILAASDTAPAALFAAAAVPVR